MDRGQDPGVHLLQPVSLRGHAQLQGVVGGHHLAHGELHRLFGEDKDVAVGLLEARRLVVLGSHCGNTTVSEERADTGVVAWGPLTLLVVRQLHVEGDAVWQRTQVLHEGVELPHQQDARLPGVAARHRHLVADNDEVLGLSEMSYAAAAFRYSRPSGGGGSPFKVQVGSLWSVLNFKLVKLCHFLKDKGGSCA